MRFMDMNLVVGHILLRSTMDVVRVYQIRQIKKRHIFIRIYDQKRKKFYYGSTIDTDLYQSTTDDDWNQLTPEEFEVYKIHSL